MATDPDAPFKDYLEARATLVKATEDTQTFIAALVRDARTLETNWRDARISHPTLPIDANVGQPGGPRLDLERWPTGQQIAERLMAWHRAMSAAQTARKRVPQALREGLLPLPD